MRTFYSTTIPDSILESARIDGSGELRTFFAIVTPLSIPGLATIGLFNLLTYWNDWWLPLTLINDEKLFNLQYLMYRVEINIAFLKTVRATMGSQAVQELSKLPSQTARNGHVHCLYRTYHTGLPVPSEIFRQRLDSWRNKRLTPDFWLYKVI